MPGILREVTKHTLKIRRGSKSVKQRLHRIDEEKRRAIDEEIAKLLVARFIKEVCHPESLANPILFTEKKFLRFYDEYHIRVDWATVAHPRTNRQVNHTNGMALQGLWPRIFNWLNKFGRQWVTELLVVLWSLRTTPNQAIGYTPFFMVYGSKAILPTDLDYGAPRVRAYNEQGAEASLEDAMDQLNKACDVAVLRLAKYQQALRQYHSRRVWG
ncbi:uncharacterized protein [Miscanthus floridulus]|uniref:uncharacterized protein n=1 Tax=Miscanthus floridulus TaxID=154761 RepID=UPI00345ADF92